MLDSVPPAGFEPALTAPEAAVATWRICALASRSAAFARPDSEDRSAYVPDHAYWARPRMLVLLIIASAIGPPVRERPGLTGQDAAPRRTNDLDRLGLVCWACPWSMADGMIRLHLQPATRGGPLR